ncbi:HAD family hydrolase [Alkaliphilus sp. B6464]|uniref:HAD family hydrolase n=1 Tax=Alkaliphilus sp. B6464 TaxID=2731219 RepID=UPI001BA508D5|nr:HAD family hydrolase [Alkaliphilus sp. B6464]QUH21891.1 HAD family hydrolase [Alkaliphilus sp. B6464]
MIIENKKNNTMHQFNGKVAIFDLDDTLQPTSHLYEDAKLKAKDKLIEIFGEKINHVGILPLIEEIDIEHVSNLGFRRTRFPMSVIEAYMILCQKVKKSPEIQEMRELYELSDCIYDIVEPLYKNAYKTIQAVKNMGFKVYILTAGDDVVQSYKIYKNGLYNIINQKNIIVTPHKTNDVYQRLFGKYGFNNCVMIGNSIRSDINPALEVGMYAIHIPCETVWSYDEVELNENEKFFQINRVEDLPEVLTNIFK